MPIFEDHKAKKTDKELDFIVFHNFGLIQEKTTFGSDKARSLATIDVILFETDEKHLVSHHCYLIFTKEKRH